MDKITILVDGNPSLYKSEPVEFVFGEQIFALPPAVIEAVYKYQENCDRSRDALRQLNQFIFDEDERDESSEEQSDGIEAFTSKYGIGYSEAVGLCELIIKRFQAKFDCNEEENDQWRDAIVYVMFQSN